MYNGCGIKPLNLIRWQRPALWCRVRSAVSDIIYCSLLSLFSLVVTFCDFSLPHFCIYLNFIILAVIICWLMSWDVNSGLWCVCCVSCVFHSVCSSSLVTRSLSRLLYNSTSTLLLTTQSVIFLHTLFVCILFSLFSLPCGAGSN